jgi:hypothetical protein
MKTRTLRLLRLLTALALLSPTVSRAFTLNWDSSFTAGSGSNGAVRALAELGDFIYAGGAFTTIDGQIITGLARFDQTLETWGSVGTGVNGNVQLLKVVGGQLYVGGEFTIAGGKTVNHIARWDGTEWHEMGMGLNGPPNDLTVLDGDLIVAGDFTQAGGQDSAHLARWNGTAWVPFGVELATLKHRLNSEGVLQPTGYIRAVEVLGDFLYVGGGFTYVNNGEYSRYVARWNKIDETWQALTPDTAGLTHGSVDSLHAIGSNLFIGGSFSGLGNSPYSNLLMFDTTTLTLSRPGTISLVAADTGKKDNYFEYPLVFENYGGELFMGGTFRQGFAGVTNSAYVAKWDGQEWSAVHPSHQLLGSAFALLRASDGRLWAGGSFQQVTGGYARNIAVLDSEGWKPAVVNQGLALNGSNFGGMTSVHTLQVLGDKVLAAGDFESVNNTAAKDVLLLDRQTGLWELPPDYQIQMGLSEVMCSLRQGGELYLGGRLLTFPETGFENVARFNPGEPDTLLRPWSAFGIGPNGIVFALETDGGQGLYAGGNFSQAGGQPASRIAHWDGSAWSALSTGMNQTVFALARFRGELYAGGFFTEAGGKPIANLARWNGSEWLPVGSGVNGAVRVLKVIRDQLYVGGDFTQAGGKTANRIARWDGAKWSALGSGVDGIVSAICEVGAEVLFGGSFTERLARWNGTTVEKLEGTSNGAVFVIAEAWGEVFVGGTFTILGGMPSGAFARARLGDPPMVLEGPQSGLDTTSITLSGLVNPNGLTTTVEIEYGLTSGYGQKMSVPFSSTADRETREIAAKLSGLTPGALYHYRIVAKNPAGTDATRNLLFSTAEPPVLLPFEPDTWLVSADVDERLEALPNALVPTFKATGVPRGVKLNPVTGFFTGKPVKDGYYKLKLWAENRAGRSAFQYVVVDVQPLPLRNQGSFSALLAPDPAFGGGLEGSVTVQVKATGAFSGALVFGGATYRFKGVLDASLSQPAERTFAIPLKSGGSASLRLVFDPATGELTGSLKNGDESVMLALNGWRNAWRGPFTTPSVAYQGNYTAVLGIDAVASPEAMDDVDYPQGKGYALLRAAKNGGVRWSGKLGEGTGLTLSTTLGPDGQMSLFRVLYGGKGMLAGQTRIDALSGEVSNDPAAIIPLAWVKDAATKPARNYTSGFPRHFLEVTGGRYVSPVRGERALVTVELPVNALATFEQGGLPAAFDQELNWSSANRIAPAPPFPPGMKWKFAPATGLVSGSWPQEAGRTGVFSAVLLRGLNEVQGYFLLPESPDKTSPLRSGRLWVEAVSP